MAEKCSLNCIHAGRARISEMWSRSLLCGQAKCTFDSKMYYKASKVCILISISRLEKLVHPLDIGVLSVVGIFTKWHPLGHIRSAVALVMCALKFKASLKILSYLGIYVYNHFQSDI